MTIFLVIYFHPICCDVILEQEQIQKCVFAFTEMNLFTNIVNNVRLTLLCCFHRLFIEQLKKIIYLSILHTVIISFR